MGFLRKKKIGKDYYYWYWCRRVRSRKKYGGSGKVESPDLSLGRKFTYSNRLAYFCYVKEIDIDDFLAEYVRLEIKSMGFTNVPKDCEQVIRDKTTFCLVGLKGEEPRLIFRSESKNFDLRRKANRQWIEEKRGDVSFLWRAVKRLSEDVNYLAYLLWRHDVGQEKRKYFSARLIEYRRDPAKTWIELEDKRDPKTGVYHAVEVNYCWSDNAEQILEGKISSCDSLMQEALEQYESNLDVIAKYAPPKQRLSFRDQLRRDVATLMKDEKQVRQWELELETAV